MKKPPDKYKTLKIPLKNILIDPRYALLLPISNVNKLVIHVYQFLRLWILYKFENNVSVPIITEKIIVMTFRLFLEQSSGAIPLDNIYTELQDFYNDHYQMLGYNLKKMKLSNVSSIIDYISTDILTNIENNIKYRYICHLKMFVNKYFVKQFENDEANKKLNSDDKTKMRKQLKTELSKVKNDLLNNTMTSDNKYHQWINTYRAELIPVNFGKNLVDDVMKDPQKYLIYMYKIAKHLGELGMKQIQFFSLRTNIYPKYISLDTKALIEIFIRTDKVKYMQNIEQYKDDIWGNIFDLNNKIFKMKDHKFNYLISTDGYAASIIFLHNDYEQEEIEKKKALKDGKKVSNELKVYEKLYENVSKINKKIIMKTIMFPKDIIEVKDITKYDINNFDGKLFVKTNKNNGIKEDEFKYFEELSIDELKKISKEYLIREELPNNKRKHHKKQHKKNTKVSMKEKQLKKQLKKEERKKKLYEINKREIHELQKGKQMIRRYKNRRKKIKTEKIKKKMLVYIDPGMKNIYMMKGADNKYYRYSNSQRLRETKRLKYQKKYERTKIKKQITKIEGKMRNYKCKSCTVSGFKKYIKQKNRINAYLFEDYEDTFFRQYKWYAFINKQRSDAKLVETIKRLYGDECILIIGDWSMGKQGMRFLSTPNLHLKRLLKKNFEMYDIDEYKTSLLNYKTESECVNLKVNDKNGKVRELHSVLKYKSETGRQECIQRDKNSVNNIQKLVENWLKEQKRPINYRRQSLIAEKPSSSDKPEGVQLDTSNKKNPKTENKSQQNHKRKTTIVYGKKK